MDRDELTLAIAGALVAATLLGWVLHWLFARMNRASGPRSVARTAEMAARLHLAEEGQGRAEARLAELQTDLAEVRVELDSALTSLSRARAETEEVRAAYRKAMAMPDRGDG